jgi:CBS domain-containing protein
MTSKKVQNNTHLSDIVQHGTTQLKKTGPEGVTINFLSLRHKFSPVPQTQSLFQVAQILSSDNRRVPVVEGGKVVNVISQSSIVSFLYDKLGITIDAHDASVGSLDIGSSPVLTVNQNETVINTFRKMDQSKRSGIAIVDGTGRLVGTTTGKDISLFLKTPHLSVLHRTIFQHLQQVRSEMTNIRTPCISVFSHDPLSRAIGLLAATRVHRVYVVDTEHEFRPVKVLAISDILRYLTN